MAVYVELTAVLDTVMGNSKSDIRCGGKQVCFSRDDVTRMQHLHTLRRWFCGVTTLNDLIKTCYFSLLHKGSTNRQSQFDLFLRFYCWIHVSAIVKSIIRQLKIYNRQII